MYIYSEKNLKKLYFDPNPPNFVVVMSRVIDRSIDQSVFLCISSFLCEPKLAWFGGRLGGGFLPEESLALRPQLREEAVGQPLESPHVLRGDAVPELGASDS